MRRIDKMNKDEIAKVYEGVLNGCSTCCVRGCYCTESTVKSCMETIHLYMFEEIELKPRWQLCKTDDDFKALFTDWDYNTEFCSEGKNGICYDGAKCFYEYLMEKVGASE